MPGKRCYNLEAANVRAWVGEIGRKMGMDLGVSDGKEGMEALICFIYYTVSYYCSKWSWNSTDSFLHYITQINPQSILCAKWSRILWRKIVEPLKKPNPKDCVTLGAWINFALAISLRAFLNFRVFILATIALFWSKFGGQEACDKYRQIICTTGVCRKHSTCYIPMEVQFFLTSLCLWVEETICLLLNQFYFQNTMKRKGSQTVV